ncbi:MAG: ribosomal protein S18-alanine N-acetyltransferase [Lachnospira sp.]
MDYLIRPMEERDIDEVESIEKETFSVPWSAASFLDASKKSDNIYLVCEIEGSIAGYCGVWTVLGEGNITNVAVAKDFRRRGVAKSLFGEMERQGRDKGVDIFFLEVRASNEAARKLYESLGYKQIGIRKRFYERPVEDAIVMSKMYNKTQREE